MNLRPSYPPMSHATTSPRPELHVRARQIFSGAFSFIDTCVSESIMPGEHSTDLCRQTKLRG
jgi:hypothetical protein